MNQEQTYASSHLPASNTVIEPLVISKIERTINLHSNNLVLKWLVIQNQIIYAHNCLDQIV